MTEQEVRSVLPNVLPFHISDAQKERAIQTAKQIGSSWPTPQVNLIHINYINDHDFWRIVIE